MVRREGSLIISRNIGRDAMEALIDVLNEDIETLDMGMIHGNWNQYELTLVFRRDDASGGVSMQIDRRSFGRTLGFLLD
jgi:hypothetical protein